MAGLRDIAIRWYRKAFAAPTDRRDEGLDTVLDGDAAVALAEDAVAARVIDRADGPRGVVAAATGLALAGRRASAFLSGADLAAAQDLLLSAAGKQAPLVLHVTTRAATAHGGVAGSGHDTIHLGADTGFFLLFADNVQQALDFTLIARRVAEDTLVPGLVVMDDEQTARAPQDARVPPPDQVGRFVGAARDDVDTPTESQKLLFGATRRRLPAWHDLDEPMLKGAVFDARTFALGAAARRPFFDDHVSEALQRACAEFARETGREHGYVSTYRTDKAGTVLVAQGAAVETARLAADMAGRQHGTRVGVLGIHALRPFPTREIAAALDRAERIVVLERTDAPLAAEPPLTRELRACQPRSGCVYQTAVYGIGGLPLRPEDIAELCRRDAAPGVSYLGVAFDDTGDDQPKREVLYDALRRAYPDAAGLGITTGPGTATAGRKGALVVEFHHPAAGIVREAAALLHGLNGGRVRGRHDRLIHGADDLLDPGDAAPADVIVDVARRRVVLCARGQSYRVPEAGAEEFDTLLGGLFGALVAGGLLDASPRRIASVRRALLEAVTNDDVDERITAFRAGFEALAEDDTASGETQGVERATPPAVRALGRNDDHVASLPRFWDQTGVLYRDGETSRLTADPYLATGSLPPLSATLRDLESARPSIPTFDPSLCTGCGHCWTHCPDSAIGVVAAGPAALLDAAIGRTGAEAVRQVAPKLASRIVADGKSGDSTRSTFGERLGDAFAWLDDKAPLPGDRKLAIGDGVERIVAQFGELPVAATKPFLLDAEAQRKDSGELLSIVVNPDTCKACRICIRGCEPGALRDMPRDAAVVEARRALWETWSATPDTAAATIERAASHPDVGPAAAMMLSRHCQLAMAGGDPAEAGSGQKLAVRLTLATAERQRQPVALRVAKALAECREAIEGREELVELSEQFAVTHHRIVKGEHGLGRARYGLAVSGASIAAWAAAYPGNPFQAPALVDLNGDGAQLAAGLVQGHLDETVELARLLRRARLEIERPDGIDWKRDALADLSLADLDDEELALCPPLLLLGADDMLRGRGLSQLLWLLNSGLPVKVLLLSALDLGLFADRGHNGGTGAGLLALAQRDAYVAQTSVADAVHLSDSISAALAFSGPALVQVYAPSPTRDGIATDDVLEQARLASAARVLPLFTYDPRKDGVFGTRIDLAGNPPNGSDGPAPIDWARGQDRFAPLLESPEMARAAERCVDDWQTLQELAGAVTPFTEKLETDIRAELEAEHRAELDARDEAAAAELAEVREKTKADIAGRLRSRLVELATRRKGER